MQLLNLYVRSHYGNISSWITLDRHKVANQVVDLPLNTLYFGHANYQAPQAVAQSMD